MANVEREYPKTGAWGELSEKLARYYGLPNGVRFALRRKGKASSRPFVRADFEVRRRVFKRDDHPRTERVTVVAT